MGIICSYSHRFRESFMKLDLLNVDSRISPLKTTRRHLQTYCAPERWIALQISSPDDPKRIQVCQHEPTTCLLSSCHLPTSYEAELGSWLLIWLTVDCAWREAAVWETVDIEDRPVPAARWRAQFPRFTCHGLWEHWQEKAAAPLLGKVSVFGNFTPNNSFHSRDNPMQWAFIKPISHMSWRLHWDVLRSRQSRVQTEQSDWSCHSVKQ